MSSDKEENVSVMIRCRPLPSNSQHQEIVVDVDEPNRCVQLASNVHHQQRADDSNETQQQTREFYFDRVFSSSANNEQVYMESARRLVEAAFAGYNCTIFLYGQTGTGKTHTHSGLTSSSFEHLFSLIKSSDQRARFLIRVSYYELYNEEIHDLLSKRPTQTLALRESKTRGVYIDGLSCFLVSNPAELDKLKQIGDARRSTAATKMNEHSSRSHSIFTITIETTTIESDLDNINNNKSSFKRTNGNKQASCAPKQTKQTVRLGRLHLIDLAGSERQAKSGSSGARLKEASQINLSLTCLSLVIRALTDSSSTHIPYRNSKLTRLLSGSLGGNSKTLLIACIAPEQSNFDETLSTLRFASRTKRIKNKAKINEDPKDALLRKYKRQVSELRRKLLEQQQQRQIGYNEPLQDDQDANDAADIKARKQLDLLKAKIMVGGENLLDKMELHARLLEASRAELDEKKRQESKLRKELDEKRTLLELVEQSKGSLDSQRHQLESKLRRAIALYKKSKLEKKDLSDEHENLKESLLQVIKATSKEIKYVDCIIEDFIPREHLDLINAYAQYDDESDEWQIKYIAMSGNNVVQTTTRVFTKTNNAQNLNR